MRKSTRFKVLERDGYRCRYCGRGSPEVRLHVDHVHPKSKGGSDRLDNLVTACRDCNLGKAARVVDRLPPPIGQAAPLPQGPWFCDQCGEPIDDDAPGGLEIVNGRDTGYPHPALSTRFRFFHLTCDPDPETEGYWIDHERARTAEQWDEWGRHLAAKVWMEGRVGEFLALWGKARERQLMANRRGILQELLR